MKLSDVKKIAVLGAGDMGHGIAEVAAMAGYKVNLYDIKQEFVDRGVNKIKESLSKQVSKQKMSQAYMDKIVGNIS
jgi:enoyl-CoA hydratase/3-hydroxyacyl-CoA dehydrogenase